MSILKIEIQEHLQILSHLMQAYEAEFSNLTEKMPDQFGRFSPDTEVDEYHDGYLLIDKNGIPVGFCIKGTVTCCHDISEFYVIPSCRQYGLGLQFAMEIFDLYPGSWQVRQIWKAEKAYRFWIKAITTYTQGDFEDSVVDDPQWGKVHLQRFQSR